MQHDARRESSTFAKACGCLIQQGHAAWWHSPACAVDLLTSDLLLRPQAVISLTD